MEMQDRPGAQPAEDLAARWDLPSADVYRTLTEEFVRIPTHTPELVPAGMRFVADVLRAQGREPRMIPADPTDILEIEVGESGQPVVWLAHTDTVLPSRPDGCEPTVRDGRLYGLGAVDTKGAIVAALLALPAIARIAEEHRIRFRIVLVGDEESGGRGTRSRTTSKARSRGCGSPASRRAVWPPARRRGSCTFASPSTVCRPTAPGRTWARTRSTGRSRSARSCSERRSRRCATRRFPTGP